MSDQTKRKPKVGIKYSRVPTSKILRDALSEKFDRSFSKSLPIIVNGKRKTRKLTSIGAFYFAKIDSNGQRYLYSESEKGFIPATKKSLTASAKSVAIDMTNIRKKQARKISGFHALIGSLGDEASKRGAKVTYSIPDDSTSRYLYASKDGKSLKIRVADHPQPVQGTMTVGGLNKKTGVRYAASDLSIEKRGTIRKKDVLKRFDRVFGKKLSLVLSIGTIAYSFLGGTKPSIAKPEKKKVKTKRNATAKKKAPAKRRYLLKSGKGMTQPMTPKQRRAYLRKRKN